MMLVINCFFLLRVLRISIWDETSPTAATVHGRKQQRWPWNFRWQRTKQGFIWSGGVSSRTTVNYRLPPNLPVHLGLELLNFLIDRTSVLMTTIGPTETNGIRSHSSFDTYLFLQANGIPALDLIPYLKNNKCLSVDPSDRFPPSIFPSTPSQRPLRKQFSVVTGQQLFRNNFGQNHGL